LRAMSSCCDFSLCPVANIAFETTEEQLRSVLSEIGPVISLKCVNVLDIGIIVHVFR